MIKVGIITFYRPINYGAILQAYALQKETVNLGYEGEIIDYRLNRVEKYRKLFCIEEYKTLIKKPKYLLKKMLSDLFYLSKRTKLKNNFNKFIKNNITLSKNKFVDYYELESFCQYYDVYVVGSDLVWNTEMAEGVNPAYFLKFVKDISKPKLSYASSIGSSIIQTGYKNDYKELLKNLDNISVREKTAVKLLSELTDKKIYNVLDPTLLLSSVEWIKIKSTYSINEKYLLVYMVEYSEQLIKYAQKIARENSVKIVYFNFKNYFGKGSINMCQVGPDVFISLFSNAEYIITNSFHGVAFSIIFEKEFWCIPHTTRGSRMIDLMNLLNLNDRLIQSEEELSNFRKINYDAVNIELNREKEKSIKYLTYSIERSKFN